MKILAIDTSCDETSVAVVENQRVWSNVISSQVRYHKKYGGVVPMLAGRLHEERIDSVIELALLRSGWVWKDVDAIAVTYGPGLAPALQVGIAKAKQLSELHKKPLYAVNHMIGHIASCFTQVGSKKAEALQLPFLAVLISGGHTELALADSFGSFQIVGQTLDDALGEAYDKVAKMLGLGYPGGKQVARLADEGSVVYELPIAMKQSGDFNLSYSGLKNAVRLLIEGLKKNHEDDLLTRQEIIDVCASFQQVAQQSLLLKVEKVLQANPEVQLIAMGGGVAANTVLRRKMRTVAAEFNAQTLFPTNAKLCTDNAAMIGVACYLGIQNGQQPVEAATLDRVPYLSLEDITFTKE
jgi:N6-L-threonylcarbamoyladenine synthase